MADRFIIKETDDYYEVVDREGKRKSDYFYKYPLKTARQHAANLNEINEETSGQVSA